MHHVKVCLHVKYVCQFYTCSLGVPVFVRGVWWLLGERRSRLQFPVAVGCVTAGEVVKIFWIYCTFKLILFFEVAGWVLLLPPFTTVHYSASVSDSWSVLHTAPLQKLQTIPLRWQRRAAGSNQHERSKSVIKIWIYKWYKYTPLRCSRYFQPGDEISPHFLLTVCTHNDSSLVLKLWHLTNTFVPEFKCSSSKTVSMQFLNQCNC